MRIRPILLLLFLISTYSYSQQEHPLVKLIENKKGKRLELYAENKDTIPYEVFLRVETSDYRRSSNRPTLQTIPPNSKKKLITLIKLANKTGKYETTFIVNEVAVSLVFRKDTEPLDLKLNKALHNEKVILYTEENNRICNEAKAILTKNNISFTEYSRNKNNIEFNALAKELKTKNQLKNVPILKVGNKIYNNIETVQDFITTLKKAIN
jgi:glutaredoxin